MKPNILLIVTDQHNARCMSCAGEPVLKTPNMDRIARDGVRFTNAFSNSIHCGPSRISFLTGTYEHTHLRHKNTDEPPDHLHPLTSVLRQSGYETSFIGKGHIGVQWPRREFDYHRFSWPTDGFPDDPFSCDYFRYLVERGQADNFDLGQNYKTAKQPAITSPMPLEHSVEMWTGNEAVDYLRNRNGEKPFFAFVSFLRPHDPLTVSAPYDRLYDPRHIVLPANADDTFESKSERQKQGMRGELPYPHRPANQDDLRKCLAHYYGLVSLIDEQIGRILKELADQGILDDTIVVYTSDHGDFAGEHGFLYKNLGFYDSIHKIPFLIRYPEKLPAGRVFDGTVESVDLYPTLTEILELSDPYTVQGRSLLKAVRGEEEWMKRASLAEHVKTFHHMSMRTPEFRITVDATGDENELYDHRNDPGELVNRWHDPDFNEIRERLLLDLLRYRACPPLLHGEPLVDWKAQNEPGYDQPKWREDICRIMAGDHWSRIQEDMKNIDRPPEYEERQA